MKGNRKMAQSKLSNVGFSVDQPHFQMLACPHYGFANLHHGAVRTYNRPEDPDTTLVTTAGAEGSSIALVASQDTRNPSGRRHGLAIAFGCEGCGQLFELTFAQQKGATLVEWRPGTTVTTNDDGELFFPTLVDELKLLDKGQGRSTTGMERPNGVERYDTVGYPWHHPRSGDHFDMKSSPMPPALNTIAGRTYPRSARHPAERRDGLAWLERRRAVS
jgi:hypothetical protein